MTDPGQAFRAGRAALLALALGFVGGCSAPGGAPVLLGIGPSAVPSIGASGSAAVRVGETRLGGLWLEGELTQQCLDDSDLADDDNPAAGDWTQLRLGAKLAVPSTDRRDWTVRAGLVRFEARGEPNLVDDPGDYHGISLGLGFETALTEHLSVGPELALLAAWEEGGSHTHLVPQLTWRVLFRL